MPIDTVAVDEAIKASTHQQIISHVNGANGRLIATANTVWSVPAGVYKFKVYLAGGGGKGAEFTPDPDLSYPDGRRGGHSPLCSKVFSGYAPGTSFNIVIGAGGTDNFMTGGTSTFGAVLQSTGGLAGFSGGTDGTHNGEIAHINQMFLQTLSLGYGQGSDGGTYRYPTAPILTYPTNGGNGICVIEW